MSVYIKCPSCGRLLADKEIKYEEGIKKINNEVLTEEERESKIMKLIDSEKSKYIESGINKNTYKYHFYKAI